MPTAVGKLEAPIWHLKDSPRKSNMDPRDFFYVRFEREQPTSETHFFAARERKPISLRPRAGVAINRRIASKTTLNCLS